MNSVVWHGEDVQMMENIEKRGFPSLLCNWDSGSLSYCMTLKSFHLYDLRFFGCKMPFLQAGCYEISTKNLLSPLAPEVKPHPKILAKSLSITQTSVMASWSSETQVTSGTVFDLCKQGSSQEAGAERVRQQPPSPGHWL
jgi:hypothetical protein